MRYIYFADFVKNERSQFEVTFPDLAPNVATYGNNLAEALHMANDALSGYLVVMEDDGDRLPPASDAETLLPAAQGLLVPIEVDTRITRERDANQSVKKTLTIPAYLNDLGMEQKINFSLTLTEALKERLLG